MGPQTERMCQEPKKVEKWSDGADEFVVWDPSYSSNQWASDLVNDADHMKSNIDKHEEFLGHFMGHSEFTHLN